MKRNFIKNTTITFISALAGLVITQSAWAAVGDLDKDYSFTPVEPCRILDTRSVDYTGGGEFAIDDVREFHVYGDVATITAQGGNTAGCPSPVGEPRGVMVNITAVPSVGQGNLLGYPAGTTAPAKGSTVNYKTGLHNIANAASFKTRFLDAVTTDLALRNRFGSTHVTMDVLGYYNAPDVITSSAVPVGVKSIESSDITPILSNNTLVASIEVTALSDSWCLVTAVSTVHHHNPGTNGVTCSVGTSVIMNPTINVSSKANGNVVVLSPLTVTRGLTQNAGDTETYKFICDKTNGRISMDGYSLTAVCAPNQY